MVLATLPQLLGLAWLLPLASFALIVFFGPRMGRAGKGAGYLATAAIFTSFLLSAAALVSWLSQPPMAAGHAPAAHTEHAEAAHSSHGQSAHAAAHGSDPIPPVSGEWYELAHFGRLRMTIGYYIDALTVAMFFMVTLVATCIHVYSFGYMHEELKEVTDPLVAVSSGEMLRRRGRFHRFYQYLSLFCFSMLGLVIADNVLMVFIFWELVGICSYFLIGFYFERRSASNAANKAFIVNRVGDFGMIIGLMAVWAGLGTFNFGDTPTVALTKPKPGIFSQVRPEANGYELTVPDGMVRWAARSEIEEIYRQSPDENAAKAKVASMLPQWRQQGYGYWLLVVAGLGIFCGCVGKSAQFPLHVWLPDAMEGPTPVSALIHAATMVAAGVYLVGRFFPVFTPEVLIVIACVGCITLFIAATIAITATDIKRVLAYSTVSQLGYMMLALGVGGWVAGLFHLFTHAFFKALLFLCSGSVIHACGTNDMQRMGGLRKKMPWTAYTMLTGCLAIAGAGIPLVIGLSGYYSKDAILAQLLSFKQVNPLNGWLFYVATAGAGITAFYMFRLWYMTFAGTPRDHHIHHHAHEAPKTMYVPLVVLAVLAVVSGWGLWGSSQGFLPALLEQARPLGTSAGVRDGLLWPSLAMPAESQSHAEAIHVPVSLVAFLMALSGFALATAFYGLRVVDAEDARRQFAPLYLFFRSKWLFDELYGFLFVRPALRIASWAANLDKKGIDYLVDGSARAVRAVSTIDDRIDRWFVDGLVNSTARWLYAAAIWLRTLQTGSLRQYVMQIAVGLVGLFVLISLYYSYVSGN